MGAKILIIEDSSSVAQMLSIQLQKAGFEPAIAPDAMMGVQQAIRWRPDLIILDLLLPAGGGASVLKRIRDSMLTRAIPVLVLTGSKDSDVRRSVLQYGVKTILEKPHDPAALIAAIHQLLSPPQDPGVAA